MLVGFAAKRRGVYFCLLELNPRWQWTGGRRYVRHLMPIRNGGFGAGRRGDRRRCTPTWSRSSGPSIASRTRWTCGGRAGRNDCREFASPQQREPRVQSAPLRDPLTEARRIEFHQNFGPLAARSRPAPAVGKPSRMESEHGVARRAQTLGRDYPDHDRTG